MKDYSAAVQIKLHLIASSVTDLQKTGIYIQPKDSKWSYFGIPSHDSKINAVQFSTSAPGSFTAIETLKSFTDTSNHWANHEIEVLAAHHLVTGKTSSSTFKPNDNVNQAEFNSLLDRLLSSSITWDQRIAETGSRNELTREQVAVLLSKTLDHTVSEVSPQLDFKDQATISSDARAAVSFVVTKGYLQGNPNHSFDPKGTLTRAQAVLILYRVLLDSDAK